LAECGISLVTERADQNGQGQRIEIALSSLKRAFGLDGTLATTLVGLVFGVLPAYRSARLSRCPLSPLIGYQMHRSWGSCSLICGRCRLDADFFNTLVFSANFAITGFSEDRYTLATPSYAKDSSFRGCAGRTRRVCCVRYVSDGGHVKAQDSYLPSS
jgi:hypothetical protein